MLPCACLFFISTIAAGESHSHPSGESLLLETNVGIQEQLSSGHPVKNQDTPVKIVFNFEVSDRKGNPIYNDAGTVTISGNRFHMEVAEDFVMVSDGNTLWIYKPQSEDIIVMDAAVVGLQNASVADSSLEQALLNLATLFGYSEGSSSRMDIKRSASGDLSQIHFVSTDNSSYTVKVKSVEPLAGNSPDSSYFTLQVRDYPNAIVTDMR